MNARERKGLEIAQTMKIVRDGDAWVVPSQNRPKKTYRVVLGAECSCTCQDWVLHKDWCKHMYAVREALKVENGKALPPGGKPGAKEKRPTYKQDWPVYNEARTKEKPLVQVLLRDLCGHVEVEPPTRRLGRPCISLADIVYALVYKAYTNKASREFTGDLMDVKAKGYIELVPHFNSVCNYMAQEWMTPILTKLITVSASPLKMVEKQFAVDATGFSTCKHKRWFDQRTRRNMEEHEWVAAHVMCGVKSHVVTAAEVTPPYKKEGPRLPKLLRETAKLFGPRELYADKAFSSKRNLEEAVKLDVVPYIPFTSRATGWTGGIWQNLFELYRDYKDEFFKRYHMRSNVETTFMAIKTRFGAFVRSRSAAGMRNEVLCKIIAHNLCCVILSMFEFGVEPTFVDLPSG